MSKSTSGDTPKTGLEVLNQSSDSIEVAKERAWNKLSNYDVGFLLLTH